MSLSASVEPEAEQVKIVFVYAVAGLKLADEGTVGAESSTEAFPLAFSAE